MPAKAWDACMGARKAGPPAGWSVCCFPNDRLYTLELCPHTVSKTSYQLEGLKLGLFVVGQGTGAYLGMRALAVEPWRGLVRDDGAGYGVEDAERHPLLLFLYVADNVVLEGSQRSSLLRDSSGAAQLGEDGRALGPGHDISMILAGSWPGKD